VRLRDPVRPRRQGGFTLIEILVVLSLLAVLMGLGVGFLQALGKGNVLVQTTHSFANLLATARSGAYGSSTAYVAIESDADGDLVLRVFRNRQVFHFPCEDLEKASADGVVDPAGGGVEIVGAGEPGREGRYAVIGKGGRFALRNQPWLQFRDGFALQCRIRPDPGGGRLFKMGEALEVRLIGGDAGRLGVEVRVRLDKDEKGEGGGDYTLQTGWRDSTDPDKAIAEWASPVLPGRWHDLRVSYDRNTLSILVDDRVRGVLSEKHNRLKPEPSAPLVVGDGYAGGFDSLLISGIFEDDDDRVEGSDGVVLLDDQGAVRRGTTTNVHFSNRSLDPRRHGAPLHFTFRLDLGADKDRGQKRVVDVGMSGETFVREVGEEG
jgi:prepilin-type N-terminal cleavage/methylation domain-containing protein